MKKALNWKILLVIFVLELFLTSFKLKKNFQKILKFNLFCGDPSNDPQNPSKSSWMVFKVQNYLSNNHRAQK